MNDRKRHLMRGVAFGVIGTLLALFIAVLVVAYGGAYNVAATREHTAGVRWFLERTMHSSVSEHASDAPASTLAAADVVAGGGEYRSMCEHCHGGPGTEPADWSRGMKPQPPRLVDAAREWSAGEVKWIVEHGITSTGMPAFGPSHDEATLWNIAAFVKRLPGMTPAQYRAYPAAHGHGGPTAGGHPGGHDAPGASDAAGHPGAHAAAGAPVPADDDADGAHGHADAAPHTH